MEITKADFHTHTWFSDSSRSPAELLNYFLMDGIKYAAVTDHDSLKLYEEGVLEEIADEMNTKLEIGPERRVFRFGDLVLFSGIELSTKLNGKNQHIIGLGVRQIEEQEDKIYFSEFKKNRLERMQKMVEEIEQLRQKRERIYFCLGERPLSYTELLKEMGEDAMPTRLHLGAYFHRHYRIGDNPRAAMNILVQANLSSYSYQSNAMTTEKAIDFIHKNKGVAILPHLARPSISGLVQRDLVGLTNDLAYLTQENEQQPKIDGIEINPKHIDNKLYKAIAEKLRLLQIVGTDDHGENRPKYYGKDDVGKLKRIQLNLYHVKQLVNHLNLQGFLNL